MTDPRIEWLCENVPSFKPAYLAAEKARQESEENRRKYAYLTAANLRRFPEEKCEVVK